MRLALETRLRNSGPQTRHPTSLCIDKLIVHKHWYPKNLLGK